MSVIFERFSECAGRTPGKPALILDDKVFTYAELHTLTTSVAAGLFAAGARQDDHIGVILGNTPEFVILMLAAAKLGLVLVPINPSLSAEGIAHAFLTADVQHVVGSKLILEDLKTLWHPASSTRPGIWVTVGGITEHAIAFEDLLSFRTKNDSQPEATFPKDQPFILTMTSGSTGDPKPIIFSQQTKVERATAAQNLYGVTANDITLAATPLYHSLAERLVLLPLMTGGTAVVMPRFTADQWISIVKSHAVTFSIAVSSQLKQILAAMRQHAVSLPSLRCLVSSSALLETSLKSELLSFLHCEFHECYGTSEIAIATNLDPDGARKKVASVGTAIPGVDVKILGADGELCGAGQVGEIICKTPMLFSGYYKRAEATAEAMWNDYFRTGDVGMLDEDGFLKFLGREKEIIITGGINVYPKDIEDVLSAHPSVLECAAVPVRDDRLGEIVGVVLAPQLGFDLDMRELRRLCARKLADYQQPHLYQVVETLPKNSMGKIMKRELSATFTPGERKPLW